MTMNKKKLFDDFTKIYSLQKTLRFELKPMAASEDHLEDFKSARLKETVEKDKQRAKDYQEIKGIIDDYHRDYIEEKLSSPVDPETGEQCVTTADLREAFVIYQQRSKKDKKKEKVWTDKQTSLRKNLTKCFSDSKKLFSKELITKTLPEQLKKKGKWDDAKHEPIFESFKQFTSYFGGFHKNRENMYSDKAQVTAIAHRLMHENLPRFFNNCIDYEKITKEHSELAEDFDNINTDILENLGVSEVSGVFQPEFFIELFTQTKIDAFRELLGGRTEQDGTKHPGLNERINLYRQKKSVKAAKLPDLRPLRKQILSHTETTSFIPKRFEEDKELLDALREFIKQAEGENGMIARLSCSLRALKEADPERTYIKSSELSQISHGMFKERQVILNALEGSTERLYPPGKNEKITKKIKKRREDHSKQKIFSLKELDEALTRYIDEQDDPAEFKKKMSDPDLNKTSAIQHWIADKALETAKNADTDGNKPDLKKAIDEVRPLLDLDELSKDRRRPNKQDNEVGKGYQQVQAIRAVLDGFKAVQRACAPLHLVDNKKPIDLPDCDRGFYNKFSESYEDYIARLTPLYNKTRDYLTKKPFSVDKIKINFDNATLLAGWDVNKEKENLAVLLEKQGQYYLGIMYRKHNKLFELDELNKRLEEDKSREDSYRKMHYKQVGGFARKIGTLVRVNGEVKRFTKHLEEKKEEHIPKIYEIKKKQSYLTDKEYFNKKDLATFIEYYQEAAKDYSIWDWCSFKFKKPSEYETWEEFIDHGDSQAYKISFDQEIPVSYIDNCIEEGKLFLFQIYNKDFSTKKRGGEAKPNLHTLYWRGLFEAKNLQDVVLKLNGGAEMFYRQPSIRSKDSIRHRANKPIENKTNCKKSTFKYHIIKDRRYTVDKFLLHVPITLNFKAKETPDINSKVNRAVCDAVKNNNDNDAMHIIGIDRGERHLLYYTVIDRQGSIIKQGTLNKIDTGKHLVDYREKLDKKEKERDKARKDWGTIESIKELKAGYLSQVVHKLAGLIIEHNAIVCLEDLNFGFKRGRFKVEKQVYQKFEKALIDKLNYLVFKDRKPGEAGHYLNAHQLTAPFTSFEKLGKQSGVLYYVPAYYTSKIDYATGFIDFLKPRYKSLDEAKRFFDKMKSIRYNVKAEYFEFKFDYRDYEIRQSLGKYRPEWTVCTHGDTRYWYNRKEQKTETVNVTKELKELFDGKEIGYEKGDDFKDAIINARDAKFYKELYRLLRLTLTLRHSNSKEDKDFILSPVKDKDGQFFDSRKAKEDEPQNDKDFILSPVKDKDGQFFDSRKAKEDEPKNADANGAYHIALKGIWILEKITERDKEEKLNLAMKNEDWFDFIQSRVNPGPHS